MGGRAVGLAGWDDQDGAQSTSDGWRRPRVGPTCGAAAFDEGRDSFECTVGQQEWWNCRCGVV